MEILSIINEGSKLLKKSKISSHLLDSEILLSTIIKKKREYLILNPKKEISDEKLSIFKDLIYKRSLGKPIAHLLGKKDFWKDEFLVSENVLIPRPDTEILIETILKLCSQKKGLRILDIGLGSGCIILSILREKKDFLGVGIDISKKCVELSRKNTIKMGLKNRIKIFKSDIDNFNSGKYDLIVSNPPYINRFDLKNLDRNVVDFEPTLALYGGLDGLFKIKKVIEKSSKLLKKNGKLVIEIAYDQKDMVCKMLNLNNFYVNKVVRDYAKNDRCIVSTKIWFKYKMVTFRNNNGRRNNFRRPDRGFKSNGDRSKFNSNFSNNENFQRKSPGRNNHNASKLIDKYNNLAREALSTGDKILSENYFQHADHFTRILNEQEINKKMKFSRSKDETANTEEKKTDGFSSDKIDDNSSKVQSEVN